MGYSVCQHHTDKVAHSSQAQNERTWYRKFCTALQTKTNDDNKIAKVTRGIHTDCLLNYETVKYFGGEQHEGERYREAIREYQALEYKVTSVCSYCIRFLLLLNLLSVSLNILNLVQNFIIVSRFIISSCVRSPKYFVRLLDSLLDL